MLAGCEPFSRFVGRWELLGHGDEERGRLPLHIFGESVSYGLLGSHLPSFGPGRLPCRLVGLGAGGAYPILVGGAVGRVDVGRDFDLLQQRLRRSPQAPGTR